ncbi:hypothetical protein [[Eubacterium] cellulosolvens]
MSDYREEEFRLRPIVNASYPATLAALSLAVIEITGVSGVSRYILGSGALTFTICAFTFFFYSIYPTRRYLWSATAIIFIIGLVFTLLAVLSLLFFVS